VIARLPVRRLAGERGQSLVLTLLVLFILAIALSTVIIFTSSNQRNSSYQKAVQTANSLAEAGLNNAISVLANPNNSPYLENSWATSTQVPLPDGSAAHPATSKSYSGGTVQWYGTLDTSSEKWTVYGKATVANPTGPNAAPIVKTIHATVQVNPPQSNSYQVGVWNTVYSPFGPTPGVCDTSIGQGITISVPVYVGGNLCMGQNAGITRPVYVGGFLFFNNKQGFIGTSIAPVSSAHVGSYCQVQNTGGQVNPCKSEPVSGPNKTNIWVSGAPTSLSGVASDFVGISAPKICWSGAASEVASGACTNTPPGGWYTFASPGPNHSCNTSSTGSVPVSTGAYPAFDTGDGSMNRSLPTVFNLTPAASYSCYTGQGQLSWNATTRTLTVNGTVFFDGSITMTTSGNQPMTYTGTGNGGACTGTGSCQSVIYASGDITIDSEKLCAKLNSQGSDCDWSTTPANGGWNPNNKILIFASNGTTGVTVGPSQTSFQGGLYATNTIATGQSALTEGPLVSGTKTVVLGQQFGGTFPAITIAPFAIQQQPGGFYISPPTDFSYTG
jgi:Tfp pilus assembly protein PilX